MLYIVNYNEDCECTIYDPDDKTIEVVSETYLLDNWNELKGFIQGKFFSPYIEYEFYRDIHHKSPASLGCFEIYDINNLSHTSVLEQLFMFLGIHSLRDLEANIPCTNCYFFKANGEVRSVHFLLKYFTGIIYMLSF